MPRFVPIDATRCRGHGWQRYSDYEFAAGDPLVPIVAEEIPHVLATLPMAFRPLSEKNRYELVAVMSLEKNRNLCVQSNGRWIGGYVPAAYRSYPFLSIPEKGTGRMALCFDMDSGLYREEPGPKDTLFFGENGELGTLLSNVVQFMQKYESQRRLTSLLTAELAQQGVIVPWQIKVQDAAGNSMPIEGLFKIDEKALKNLPAEKSEKLRKADALPMAYGQFFSQHRISNLARLNKMHEQMAAKTPEIEIEKLFGQNDAFAFDE